MLTDNEAKIARIFELEAHLKKAEARNALLFKEKADAINRIAEPEAQLRAAEQFARDIAHKLDIEYTPPVAEGECVYLKALEGLKEQKAELETRLKEAQTHKDVWRDKWERANERAGQAESETGIHRKRVSELLAENERLHARAAAALGEREVMGARLKEAEEANKRLAELEARLGESQERIKTLEAANTSWKHYHDAGSTAYERATAAEAKLSQSEARNQRLEILGAQLAGELGAESMEKLNKAAGRAVDIQTRLAEIEARAEGFQKVYEDALTGNQAILQRATTAEAKLKEADRQYHELSVKQDEGRRLLREAEARAEKRRIALERLEWSKREAFTPFMTCPVCLQRQHNGHKEDCFIAAALSGQEGAAKGWKAGDIARTPFEPSGLVEILEIEPEGALYGVTALVKYLEDHHGYAKGTIGRYPLSELRGAAKESPIDLRDEGQAVCECGHYALSHTGHYCAVSRCGCGGFVRAAKEGEGE